ncbi:uncharacterized protein RCH25_043034 [Pelodytes ibericus]
MATISHMAAVTIVSVLLGTVIGHPHRRHCQLSRYKSIPPSVMAEVRELQNPEEEKEMGVKCAHHGLRLKRFPQCDIKGHERLTLTLHRVSLAVEVLHNRSHNLDLFSALKKDLSTCNLPSSSVLDTCRGHLDRYMEKVSDECLHHDVLLNLVWLLVEDLRSLTHGEHDGHQNRKEDPEEEPPTQPAPHKPHPRRKPHRRNSKHKAISS